MKKTPHTRIAYTAMIASILLVASLAVINTQSAAGTDDKISATGTTSSVVASPDVAQRTVGDLFIQNRILVATWSGTLSGKSVQQQTIAENTTAKKSFGTYYGTFTGTLDGSAPGTFSFIVHTTGDRTACPCPPGTITFVNTFVVVEGTGQAGLEGICGGGIATGSGNPVSGFTTTYDFTFRFGKDCKANN